MPVGDADINVYGTVYRNIIIICKNCNRLFNKTHYKYGMYMVPKPRWK